MNGFCGILGDKKIILESKLLVESINLAKTMKTDSISGDNYFFAISYLEKSPLKGNRIYQTEEYIYLFGGDLINYENIPWAEIEKNFLESNFSWFLEFKGFFSLAIYNIRKKSVRLISDYFSQLPIYYGTIKNNFIFSSNLSSFSVLKEVPKFNVEWLYEYLFFNFPIDKTTFYKGINRIRPFTILQFDLSTGYISSKKYGNYFKKHDEFLKGERSLNEGKRVFREIIPKYFDQNGTNLVAFSGGFDSRTVLSLAPNEENIKTYTYGVKDCDDLNKVHDTLNYNHKPIYFNQKFEEELPTLIFDTIRLSGGVQPILRATLQYVYKTLYDKNKEVSVAVGGINGDFFRGWNWYSTNISVNSSNMRTYFTKGVVEFDEEVYSSMFGKDIINFKNHINHSLNVMNTFYGSPLEPIYKMNFVAFQTNPRYFGGEMAISSNFFMFRQPFLDKELMELAFKTENGHLGNYERIKAKGDTSYKKYVFQSQIIHENSKFRKSNINGVPIILYAMNNKSFFTICRPFIRALDYLKGYKKPANDLEEWDDWFKRVLKSTFDNILNSNSEILKYVDKDFIDSAKQINNIHMISKLVTTEIILILIKNKWNIKI